MFLRYLQVSPYADPAAPPVAADETTTKKTDFVDSGKEEVNKRYIILLHHYDFKSPQIFSLKRATAKKCV